MDLPDDFRCPISLEVMNDPVILTSGHTFDRASIQRWIDAGNLTCPLTNLTLTPTHDHSPILTPNLALRRLIQNSVYTPPLSPNSLPYPSDPQSLSSLLKSIQKSAEFRQRVAESNFVRSLLRHVADPRRPDAQKLAIHSVLYLSLDGDDVKVGLVAEGAVDCLVTAVNSNGAVSAAAATAITSLATVDVNKVTIGAHPTAISSLAAMLLEGSTRREKKEAATAIYELCKFSENRRRVIRVGAVRSLVTLASLGLDRAIEILGQLAKVKEGREEMGKAPQFVRTLVGVIRSGTSRGIESAISVMSLVCGDERICFEAVNEGILEVLEKLCVGESGKIAKNAMGVLDKLKKLRKEEF